MKNYIIITIGTFFFAFFTTFSQESFRLTGSITDTESNLPLAAVNIRVKGSLDGAITNSQGQFILRSSQPLPIILILTKFGYAKQEITVNDIATILNLSLQAKIIVGNEIVVSASKVEESMAKSPVAIEKLSAIAIRETPAASFFDALEALKGVQMTTLSLAFKVPNTRGFNNTTNARFLQLVDGADTQAPGLGVSIANTVGPTELDVESVEIVPGASSALYGMNALNGVANIITKNPFWSQGLSIYHKTGINHIDGIDHKPSLFIESALRYAHTFNDRLAIKINVGYFRGTDWIASNPLELNPNANSSTQLLGLQNPAQDPINSYGNENGNRRVLTVDGKRYEVRRTGYWEKELVTDDYRVQNIKTDIGLFYKIEKDLEIDYSYRFGTTDAIYQRGNRIRLTDYQVHQHKAQIKGASFFLRGYWTLEGTDKSYNIRPIGENMDKAFKSDERWYTDYTDAFNHAASLSTAERHLAARTIADRGRLQPGTTIFDQKLRELSLINNWDIGGQLIMQNQFYHIEGQYTFINFFSLADILIGADYRDFIIKPEGNSFTNPDIDNPYKTIHNYKFGFFIQATKRLLNDNLKVIASTRIEKNEYFDPKFNPRIALVYTFEENHNFRASYQNGYRFPTVFEGFSTVNNNGIIRYGGLDVVTKRLQLFENSYLRSSVDKFQTTVTTDINKGKTRNQAIVDNKDLLIRNDYTYLQPEAVNALDLGYKGSLLDDMLFVDVDFYYNSYLNFIDQIEVAVPKAGKIGDNIVQGVDATVFEIEDLKKQTRYRMWTNSKSRYYNYGASLGINYTLDQNYNIATNISYAELAKIDRRDAGLETSFNTPAWIFNLNLSNRRLTENFGFSIAYRWQSEFLWFSQLGNGTVPAYGSLDAQVSYKIPTLQLTAKLGGSNLLNTRYYQYIGGPTVGGMYYLAFTFDNILGKL